MRQKRGHALRLFPARRINNCGTTFVIAKQFQRQAGPLRRTRLHHFDRNIRAPKAVDKTRLMIEAQLPANVVLHDRGRRRRQRNHRCRPQRRQIAAEQPVIRAKIMSPLRNAMRFVNGDQRRLALREHLRKTRHAQPLRRDKQKL